MVARGAHAVSSAGPPREIPLPAARRLRRGLRICVQGRVAAASGSTGELRRCELQMQWYAYEDPLWGGVSTGHDATRRPDRQARAPAQADSEGAT